MDRLTFDNYLKTNPTNEGITEFLDALTAELFSHEDLPNYIDTVELIRSNVKCAFRDPLATYIVINSLTHTEYKALQVIWKQTQQQNHQDQLVHMYRKAGEQAYDIRKDTSLHAVFYAFKVLRWYLLNKYKSEYTEQEIGEMHACNTLENSWIGIGGWLGS